jgi:hypothetical protein
MKAFRTLALSMVAVVALGVNPRAMAEALGSDIGLFGAYLDSDDFQEAYGAGGKVKISVAEFLALDARGSYLEFSDTDVTMIPVELLVLLQIPVGDALRLYGGAGAGYYFMDADRVELDDNVGYFPVAGAELGNKVVKFFGEVRWLALTSDVDEAENELEGIADGDSASADGLGINVGLVIDL